MHYVYIENYLPKRKKIKDSPPQKLSLCCTTEDIQNILPQERTAQSSETVMLQEHHIQTEPAERRCVISPPHTYTHTCSNHYNFKQFKAIACYHLVCYHIYQEKIEKF